MSTFQDIPDESFLRVFHADRDLTPEERQTLHDDLSAFLGDWSSHEAQVTGRFAIVHDRFVVVSADESKVPLSGCSKDSVVMRLRDVGARIGVDFVHAPPLCYRDEDGVHCVQRAEFGELVAAGRIKADTVVFDSTIITAGPFKAGRWEVPASECWHARAYELVS